MTDPAIGEALGRAIVCLADHHGRPVTVVAHSMGGLATRQAQGQVAEGRPVSASLDRVITVGTPFQGTQLLGFAGGPGGDLLREVVGTALRACDTNVTHRPGRSFCDLLGASETAAVQGMIPGSAQLDALPRWAPHVRIAPIAAEIEIGIDGPFGFSEQLAVGDFAVSVESATADSSSGIPRFVATCHASLFGLVEALDGSPCSHANELANRRIIHRVRQLVRAIAAHESATTLPRHREPVFESVEAQRCVPQHGTPRRVVDVGDQLEELVDSIGERCVGVGEVARPHHVIGADL